MNRTLFFLFAVAIVWLPSMAFAAEQRCTELSANCVCSEPLNTNVLSPIGGTGYIDPGDSTVKTCNVSMDGQPAGAAIFYNQPPYGVPGPTGIQSSNDSVVLSRMPQHQSILQFFVRGPEGQIGEFSVGNMQFAPQGGVAPFTRTQVAALLPGILGGNQISIARWAQRFYVYYSDNFEMGGDGQCGNGKMLLADQVDVVHGFQGTSLSAYNFGWNLDASLCTTFSLGNGCGRFKLDGPGGTNLAADCCTTPGPSTSSTAVAPIGSPLWRGRWWMVEAVTTNRVGPGYRLQVFLRDITDNTPEQQIIDTNGTYGHGGEAGAWTPSAQLTPSEITPIANFLSGGKAYGYRGGTPCAGWKGYSYYMQAQWDTNAGQRIGPATEVEGGTSDTTPPAAPTGLRAF
ncbi:MAG TPA: hypothetical protein VKB81_05565 [Nitrospira sp.]|nr:hypothetical protein [Nitrospira sp.]